MSTVELVDSHCHLPLMQEEKAGFSLQQVLDNAAEAHVSHMLCACIDLDGHPGILEIAAAHPQVFASVGIHPNTETGDEPAAARLAQLAGDEAVVAIGETGLDYFRSEGDLEWQRERFRRHIRAAREVGKPLIIHTREARDDVIRILREEGADAVGGVMHCFVEDWDTAQAAMDLGFYISLSGIVTFRNAGELKEIARRVPLDRLLVETDSPYLAPVPFRGKPNQPAYVRHVAATVAELREMPLDELARATTSNFFHLFAAAKA